MLTLAQQAQVDAWFPGAELVADLSWPEALTRVLRLRTLDGDVVVKAAGEVMAGHAPREIAAGRQLHGPGLPELLAASEPDRVLALRFQPGELVQDAPAEDDPVVFAAMGRLLATVRLIDFGRYALRPAYTDLVRVWHRYPEGDPRVDALVDGLGIRRWDGAGWWAERLYQGVSTVVWASDRGFDDFAEDGRRMLRRALGGTMDR
ncbi:hypothetical protein [Cellulomonas sp. NPDC089187]|uniref:hypothetical protein n=1 Tax=Cellulomonas sp. NPDC089187 TaxID=3154970 RepID=UPI00343A9C5A